MQQLLGKLVDFCFLHHPAIRSHGELSQIWTTRFVNSLLDVAPTTTQIGSTLSLKNIQRISARVKKFLSPLLENELLICAMSNLSRKRTSTSLVSRCQEEH